MSCGLFLYQTCVALPFVRPHGVDIAQMPGTMALWPGFIRAHRDVILRPWQKTHRRLTLLLLNYCSEQFELPDVPPVLLRARLHVNEDSCQKRHSGPAKSCMDCAARGQVVVGEHAVREKQQVHVFLLASNQATTTQGAGCGMINGPIFLLC